MQNMKILLVLAKEVRSQTFMTVNIKNKVMGQRSNRIDIYNDKEIKPSPFKPERHIILIWFVGKRKFQSLINLLTRKVRTCQIN